MRSLWRFRSGLLSARAERVVIAVLLSVATEVAGTIGLTASIVTQREAILASVAAARARVTLSLGERRDFSLEQWERSADECILTQRAALRLQTAYRRARDARLVEEYRAWRDFAVLVLQKNVRRWFAQRQLFKLRRHRVLRETVTAENERLAMESEEEETREFLYLEIMWRRVENLVRRKLAWKRTATLRAEITKHKQRAFLTKRGADIEEMQRREQQRALDEIRETEAALAIQRRFRGAVGRRRFRNKLHVQLDALAAIRCQTAYRAAMGRRKAAAMRRTIAAQQYFRANRRVQGAVLRLLGKKQRKTQRELLRVLVPLGLDPLSFTLSLKAQLRDLRADMLRKPVPPVDCGDPVQHRSGKTAFLVAIDKSIPENPVAELTFDDDGGRSSVPVDALVKFERAAKRKIRIFSAADRAALKIQLLARRRQAMRRVARHRYAFWRDSHAKRRVLLAVLTSFDALQHDAVRVLRRLHGLRLEHFDLPIVPSAFAKVQRDKRLERQIKAELKLRAHLRAKRVRHLRKGARPNNAVKKALFGTQTMTTVRDSEADERDWARFLNAAPPARQMRTRWAPPFLHAHFLFGADAVLALAVRKKLATAATSVRAKPIDISTQFGRSPHLRVREVAFYHGTWPEGEGFLEFLDGYGCEEEKTLRVRIIRAQDLRASDLSTSDPYVRIKCNGRTFRSRTKLRTLNPVYDEVFEVDVSDPKERLVLELWDWDKFSADDYLGSAQIQLGAMDLTAPRRFWIYLGYYPSRGQQTHDRGALEIELQWMEKMSAEDLDLRRMRRRAALRLETWARGRLAVIQRRALERSHRTALNFIFESASTIQTTWRALMSRRFVKKVRVQRRAALRLQALCRRKLAFLDLQELRKRFHAALTIQRIRGARLLAARLRLVRWIEETYAALVIQAFSRSRVRRPRARKGPLDWLAWYGRDFLYGSKRLRRICHRAMRVLLNTGGRVRTVYGHAIVISVNRFITVILLQTTLERTTRAERAERLATAPRHTAVLRPASLLTKVTILEKVVMLQCLFRFTKACRHVFCLFEEHRAARRVQRIARRRLGQKGRAAIKIQTRVRVDLGRKALRELRKEVAAAVKLQLKHRQRLALRRLEDKRLAGCTACLCSSEYFPASLTLESKGFWSSSRPNKQWIVYDMQDPTCIGVCDLICPDNTTAPRFVTIDVSDSATGSFETLLSAELCAPRSLSELRVLEKNAVGHRLQLPLTLRRFWRLSFLRNWGSTECVALSRVRWLVAKEFSPNILRHPDSLFVEGPQVGGWVQFELSIDAFAWPPPEFEWFRDGHPVGKGATLNVKSRVLRSAETKKFRCPHCRKVNRDVPKNVYRTLCMNCQTVFNWPEVTYKEPIDDGEISRLKRQLEREKEDYASLELQLRLQNKPIPDRDLSLEKMIQQKEEEKKRRIFEALKEPRLLEYDCEGVYTCHVSNMRRTIRRTVISEPAAILVGDPPPLKTKVVSDFRPKPHRRRKHFERYVSVHGFFRRGVVSGEVILRYASGDTYCGPIVPEKLLDHMGVSRPGADHWGLWIMPDGTRYEGATVDNHFDTRRIVGDFRVTTTTEVYDGQIVDGKRHGFGECRYPDGSLYSGEWHQGLRQGFGRLEGSSVYEGDWDRDAIHGQGTWHWRDGSSYCGEAVHGIRQGVGVYVSEKHDVFIGEFADNQMHGKGVLSYHDGSRFEGELSMNSRITGVFTDIHGVRYFGTYRDGVRHGEFLVRRPVGDADEIQQGLWENGEFIEWTTLPLNPIATEQFCSVFENEEEYDGVYALMVARRLPLLPPGVQPDHPRVVPIVKRIRREGGNLVAKDTYEEAKAELLRIEPELAEVATAMRAARAEIERHSDFVSEKERIVSGCDLEISTLEKKKRLVEAKISKFWDTEKARTTFDAIVAEIEEVPVRDFFVIRYFPEPPPLLEKIMRATCGVLGEPESWKSAQLLLSASQQNADAGDKEALLASYEVKLKHKLQNYDVWNADLDAHRRVAGILVDPRFSSTHHHVTSYGVVPPLLVRLVRAAHAYVLRSKAIKETKLQLEEIQNALQNAELRRSEAITESEQTTLRYEAKKRELHETESTGRRTERRVEKVRELVLQCEAMIEEYRSDSETEEDYYKAIDKPDVLATTLDVVCRTVERFSTKAKLVGVAFGLDLDEDKLEAQKAIQAAKERIPVSWLRKQIIGNSEYSGGKLSLQQSFDPTPAVEIICNALKNYWLPGIDLAFVDVLVRHLWLEEARVAGRKAAVEAWNAAFEDPASMAVNARTNWVMSSSARREAAIWAEEHPVEIVAAEAAIAEAFEAEHEPTDEGVARAALRIRDDRELGPDAVCGATVWCKLHPEWVEAVMDDEFDLAADFEEEQATPALAAARILAGITEDFEDDDGRDAHKARAWANSHIEELREAEQQLGDELASKFEELFSEDAAAKAVRSIEPGTPARFRAAGRAWRARHQREFNDAMEERVAQRELEDQDNASQIARLRKRLEERRKIAQQRVTARNAQLARADERLRVELQAANETERRGAEGDIDSLKAECVQLLEYRVSTHALKLQHCEERLWFVQSDRAYLVCAVPSARPSDISATIQKQKIQHLRLLDAHQAAFAAQQATLQHLRTQLNDLHNFTLDC